MLRGYYFGIRHRFYNCLLYTSRCVYETDIGHAPFSHSGEDLLCKLPEQHINYQHGAQKRYTHEDYSIAIIKEKFSDIIENHTLNNNNAIKVDDVTALLGDTSVKPKAINLLWKELISGQLDADRADYLLRDSMHLGVNYGLYDRNRLVSCITLGRNEVGDVILGIERKGWHIAESIILSRYQMFSQVYCHKAVSYTHLDVYKRQSLDSYMIKG